MLNFWDLWDIHVGMSGRKSDPQVWRPEERHTFESDQLIATETKDQLWWIPWRENVAWEEEGSRVHDPWASPGWPDRAGWAHKGARSSQGERRSTGELSVLNTKERPDCVSVKKWSKVLNTGERSSRRQLKNGFNDMRFTENALAWLGRADTSPSVLRKGWAWGTREFPPQLFI